MGKAATSCDFALLLIRGCFPDFVVVRLPFDSGLTGQSRDRRDGPKQGLKHHHLYSITSSARASSIGGTSRPSALAVIRLMTRSNLVGCSTGVSLGLAPRRILSTKSAERRNRPV